MHADVMDNVCWGSRCKRAIHASPSPLCTVSLAVIILGTLMPSQQSSEVQPANKTILQPASDSERKHRAARPGLVNFKLVAVGLAAFLGISWILAQTTSLGHQVEHLLPHFAVTRMSGKRTVGYFVSRAM